MGLNEYSAHLVERRIWEEINDNLSDYSGESLSYIKDSVLQNVLQCEDAPGAYKTFINEVWEDLISLDNILPHKHSDDTVSEEELSDWLFLF